MKEKFLVVGARRLVGNILSRVFIGVAAILLRACDHVTQFLLPRLKSFSKTFQLLFIHAQIQLRPITLTLGTRKVKRESYAPV